MPSVISSLAAPSSAGAGRRPAAAFFDLDKTIIVKSGTLAYGPSFYRNGLISRGDAVRSAVAQLLFSRPGASHDRCCTGHIEFHGYGPAQARRVRQLAAGRGYRLGPGPAPSGPALWLARLRGWPVPAFSALPVARPAGGS